MSDIIADFLDAMRSAGFEPKGKIIADDKWHWAKSPFDRKGKAMTGRYSLKLMPDGRGIGQFFSFKDPDTRHNWHSNNALMMTPAERKALQKRIEAEQKAREAAEARRQLTCARRLTKLVKLMPKAVGHPYLTRKGVKAHIGVRIRQRRDELIIPLQGADGQIWSVQRITKDGKKFMFSGGRKMGSYFPLCSSKEDLSLLLLCEGYATGATIREATGKPVIVAFDSGNLKHVLEALRKKYPESKFLICADNDAYTLNAKKEPWNVGIEKAREAASSCNGTLLCWPEFPEPEEGRTDFNDLAAAASLGEVAEQINHAIDKIHEPLNSAPSSADNASHDEVGGGADPAGSDQHAPADDIPPPEQDEHDYSAADRLPITAQSDNWQQFMICDIKGKPVKGSLKNIMLMLENDEMYKGVFRFDSFGQKTMVTRCPPWQQQEGFKVHTLSDTDITQAAAHLEYKGVAPDRTKIHNAIEVVAQTNKFNPAQDYFKSLQWDGVKRLDKWLVYYLGAEDDEPEYLSFIGKKWLVAAVKRVFEAGCKFDHVLVIEGEQGRGKSTALKALCTFGDDIEESYFTDAITIADIQNKDTIQKIQGSIIVELAELAGFNKKDDEEIKRWITIQHDDCRLPYERTTTRFKRQFVLSATTNSYDYLKDPTGNRRYWPMKSTAIDLESLRKDRKQLWAEAYTLYRSGLYIGPTPEEAAMAMTAQDKRRTLDIWEDDVMKAFDKLEDFTGIVKVEDIMKEMGIAMRDRDWKSSRRVTGILQSRGYENTVGKVGGKSVRGWQKTKKQQEIKI